VKAKQFAHETTSLLTPQPPVKSAPRCSHIGHALAMNGDLGVNLGAHLTQRKGTTVPFPVGQPTIQEDGTVQPSVTAQSVCFSANPVNSLDPALCTVPAAPGGVAGEYQVNPQAAMQQTAGRRPGVMPYAPGVRGDA
jgi:hypothetical protein